MVFTFTNQNELDRLKRRNSDAKIEKMDTRNGETLRERSRRPVRNKRYSRRAGEDKRPPKRLFTPEIKKYLKDWLVRRRENPYPNRDEKKMLAVQTGLTYIQVCNWFANWRRKLKNAGKEPQQKTWGDLIKTYNNQVQGNIEHFSICSDDSIWEEPETNSNCYQDSLDDPQPFICKENNKSTKNTLKNKPGYVERGKFYLTKNAEVMQNQCYYISSTTENDQEVNPFSQTTNNKYKNHIMEKYLRDCKQPNIQTEGTHEEDKPSMISKWLESAANFKPKESSYLDWTFKSSKKKNKKNQEDSRLLLIHDKEELDAAEALTTLANSRNSKI